MTREDAHFTLFKGQSNIALMAREVGCSLESLQASFRQYVSENPIDPDVWQADIQPSWPFWS